MGTARLASGIGLWVVLSLCVAASAAAHGGNFREPGGGAAPSGPGLPPTVGPPTVTPPSGPTPPGGRRGRSGGRSSRPAWQPHDWQVWWQLNLEAYLPGRSPFQVEGVFTPSDPVFQVGRAQVGFDPPMWSRTAEEGARELALPFLVSLLHRRSRASSSMVSAALIAVGRIAREGPPLSLIRGWAVDRRASLEVRESAVLALGLLRRSEPARQLPVEKLEQIREFLLLLFDDEKNPTRIRAFALYSLALLADQPYGAETISADGRLITRALWLRLRKRYPSNELPIALLVALGRQPCRGVPSAIRGELQHIARGRNVFHRNWDQMERAHALLALGRLGGPDATEILVTTLRLARQHDAVLCAALVGLAHRAPEMPSEQRVDAARELRRRITGDRHWLVRGLGHMAMGRILNADLRARSLEVWKRTDVKSYLEREARKGPNITRPFSAVAYGLTVYRVPLWSRPAAKYVQHVRAVCAWGLRYGRGSDEVVGAYAFAVGVSQAQAARPVLISHLKNKNRSPSLRGHCALALGQLGRASQDEIDVLLAATRERVSSFVHHQAVRALALLGADDARKELLLQLEGKKSSRPALVAVAGALGRLHDPKSGQRLLDLAKDRRASAYLRVTAVMALGLTFDPEERPSRVHLTTDANFPALTSSLAQVFNIM